MNLYKVRTDDEWVMFPNPWYVIAKDRDEALDKVRRRMQKLLANATTDGYAVLIAQEHELIV
jgi:hypothetical protein